MQGKYVQRHISSAIKTYLNEFPAVAILGPRQCGKSTLASHLMNAEIFKPNLHLDLERPSDLHRLSDPEFFFKTNREKLICLDEIQRFSDLFAILRSEIDADRRPGRFLILGSASRDLIRQSSESLAGRIAFLELTPFQIGEVIDDPKHMDFLSLNRYWFRGGFPESFLAGNDEASVRWLEQFIRTFLERDIPQLGIRIPGESLGRMWRMLAHTHGEILNTSKLGQALGTSHATIRRYLEVLSKTYMIRVLTPFATNLKKRLVKSPKVYFRDTGVLHALLGIDDFNALLGHPVYGHSWEGLVIESLLNAAQGFDFGFYRTSAGAEIDLVLSRKGRTVGVECKASSTPQLARGAWHAMDDLGLDEVWIVSLVSEAYEMKKHVFVKPLGAALHDLENWD